MTTGGRANATLKVNELIKIDAALRQSKLNLNQYSQATRNAADAYSYNAIAARRCGLGGCGRLQDCDWSHRQEGTALQFLDSTPSTLSIDSSTKSLRLVLGHRIAKLPYDVQTLRARF